VIRLIHLFNNFTLCLFIIITQPQASACQKPDILNNGALCHVTENAAEVIAEQCGQRNAKIADSRNNDRTFVRKRPLAERFHSAFYGDIVTAYFFPVHKRYCALYPIMSAFIIDIFSSS